MNSRDECQEGLQENYLSCKFYDSLIIAWKVIYV